MFFLIFCFWLNKKNRRFQFITRCEKQFFNHMKKGGAFCSKGNFQN